MWLAYCVEEQEYFGMGAMRFETVQGESEDPAEAAAFVLTNKRLLDRFNLSQKYATVLACNEHHKQRQEKRNGTRTISRRNRRFHPLP